MNDKPTGEWTDSELSDIYSHGGLRGVADAHNAALAAERERHATENDAHYGYVQLAEQHLKECEQQLAAEREATQNDYAKWFVQVQELEQQLAAEREKHSNKGSNK